jgi:diguanylate cyclase (GGDEF)-like protein
VDASAPRRLNREDAENPGCRDDAVRGHRRRGLRRSFTTAQRRALEQESLAMRDPLTGLASRAYLMDQLDRSYAAPESARQTCALILLNIDGLRLINDAFGHPAGDELLPEIGRRLQRALSTEHTIARVGGDEFVVLLATFQHPATIVADAERVLSALREPVVIASTWVAPSVSIGVATPPAPDASTLLRNADIAMRGAKRLGGNRCELFDCERHAEAVGRAELARDIKIAISKREFCVYFQPVVSASGRIVGTEALVRWFHPVRGAVSPAEFIPVAEEAGLIRDIEAFVLDTSLHELASWRRTTGRTDVTVAVNLSAAHVNDPTLVTEVERLLAKHALPPSALCLELTETAVLDDLGAATKTLKILDGIGVRLALDDFGTGYSSLVHLRRLPVHMLKLDRLFIAGIDANRQDAAIVNSTIALAHSLGLCAVAEGVETQHQAHQLWKMGCDHAQGFHWSAAVPADVVAHMLRRDDFIGHPALFEPAIDMSVFAEIA